MKIGQVENKPAVQSVAADRPTTKPNGQTVAGQTTEASAQVSLSSTASTLGNTEADFDSDKVERIKAQISSGTFKINPEAIADKLISNAQELLTRPAAN